MPRAMKAPSEDTGDRLTGFYPKEKKKADLLCARWATPRPHLLPCVCGCGGGDFGCDVEAGALGSRLKTYEKHDLISLRRFPYFFGQQFKPYLAARFQFLSDLDMKNKLNIICDHEVTGTGS